MKIKAEAFSLAFYGDRMRRFGFFYALLCAFMMCPVFAGSQDEKIEILPAFVPEPKTYVLCIDGYDWGPGSYKAIVNTGRIFSSDAVSKEDFSAGVYLAAKKDSGKTYGPAQSERNICAAYLCDEHGTEISGKGSFVALEFSVEPEDSFSNPFVFYMKPGNASSVFGMKISNKKLGLSIARRSAIVSPVAQQFIAGKSVSIDDDGEKLELPYTSFIPEKKIPDKKIPLILWFHGAGEGGQNLYTPLLNAPVAKLAGEKVQQYFENGVAVLVPVCPTNWLVTVTKDVFGNRIWAPVDIKGALRKTMSPIKYVLDNISSTQADDDENYSAVVSYYTDAVKKLLDDFLKEHPEIDPDRVFVGGVSAGGYMVMNMMLQHPSLFAAAFPICEAFPDSKISNGQIEMLAEKPVWFSVSKDDSSINPAKHTFSTYERLKNCGADNAVLCTYGKIIDLNGYKDEDGKPYEYDSHFAWVYVLNGWCVSDEDASLNLFSWLSER